MSDSYGGTVDATRTQTVPGCVDVVFLDVGQGDSTLVVDEGTRRALLIDCPAGAEAVVEAELARYGATLDTAVITHWDTDHFGGMLGLLDQIPASHLYYNHDTLLPADRDPMFLAVLRRLMDPGLRAVDLGHAQAGRSGRIGNVAFTLLAPSHRQLTRAVATRRRNLGSGIVMLDAYESKILIGGDAQASVWRQLLESGSSINADVLRWPHHGAALGGSPDFESADLLAAVAPQHVVMSVGTSNTYGHPSPQVIAALRSSNTRLRCTEVTRGCHSTLVGRAVGCAGSVVARVTAAGGLAIAAPNEREFDAIVRGWDHPMCRVSSGPSTP